MRADALLSSPTSHSNIGGARWAQAVLQIAVRQRQEESYMRGLRANAGVQGERCRSTVRLHPRRIL